jgi:hypothetical protein
MVPRAQSHHTHTERGPSRQMFDLLAHKLHRFPLQVSHMQELSNVSGLLLAWTPECIAFDHTRIKRILALCKPITRRLRLAKTNGIKKLLFFSSFAPSLSPVEIGSKTVFHHAQAFTILQAGKIECNTKW